MIESTQIIEGQGVVAGVGRGRVAHLTGGFSLKHIGPQETDDPVAEVARFQHALELADGQLADVIARAEREVPEEVAVFESLRMLLMDPTLAKQVVELIQGGASTEWAVKQVICHYEEEFTRINNPYLRERLSELESVGIRIIGQLWGQSADRQVQVTEDAIVVAYDLSATELLALDTDRVNGLVLEMANETTHAIILARSLGIPVVSGVKHGLQFIPERSFCILDGNTGQVHINPEKATVRHYDDALMATEQITVSYIQARGHAATTLDDHEIRLSFNVGTLNEIKRAKVYHSGGIGLFRTELIFIQATEWPSEDEQFEIYRKALQASDGPVVFRTLDLGGDKSLSYDQVIEEDDPFLGWRGIRRSLDEPERFLRQLRALLRASAFGTMKIMLPFITTLHEVNASRALLKQAQSQLEATGHTFDAGVELGVMVETPAAVWQIDLFAKSVDFVSIGTNDLVQFIVAAGRANPRVESLYDVYHQAVLMAVHRVADAAQRHRVPVSVCGEAACDPRMAFFFMGCGIQHLSMSASRVPMLKHMVRTIRLSDAQAACHRLCNEPFPDAAEVRHFLSTRLAELGFVANRV